MLVQSDYLASVLFSECTAHYFIVLGIDKNKAAVDRTVTGNHSV